jgi:hypothetical protein
MQVNQAAVKMDNDVVQPDSIIVQMPGGEDDDEGVENVYEAEMTFGRFCCNACRYYHRIGHLIYSPNTRSSRVVKTLNTSALFAVAFAIITGCYDAWDRKLAYRNGVFLTILAMRLLQPTFNYMESVVGRASKTGNCLVGGIFALVNVAM